MSKYRYTISDGTDSFQFMPTNSISITKKRVMSSIGAWYKEKSITNVQISAKRSKELYSFLSAKCLEAIIDDTGACSTFTITLDQKQGFSEHEEKFRGLFTVRDIEHNVSLCTMTIKCTEDNLMQCFLRGIDKEFNMLSLTDQSNAFINTEEAVYTIGYTWTFQPDTGTPIEPYPGTPSGVYWVMDSVLFEDYSGSTDYRLYLWYYQFKVTDCIGGAAVPPDTSGDWFNFTQQQTGNECNAEGFAEWRKTFATDPLGVGIASIVPGITEGSVSSVTANSITSGIVTGPPSDYGCEINFGSIGYTDVPNGRRLTGVLSNGALVACPDVTSLVSQFFSGENPITGDATYENLILFQITDVKYPTADQQASRAIITMKKLLSDLNKMFDVWWFVNNDGELVIEHRTTFLEYPDMNDFTTSTKKFGTYSYNKDGLAGFKTYTTPAQSGIDFVGKQIEYSQPCTTSETESVNLELLCADVRYIIAYPDKTPDDAIVIVACTTDNFVITSNGLISNTPVTNAPLSWANLHYLFHRHNAYTLTGKLNGQTSFEDETTFLRTIPLRQGKVSVQICDVDSVDVLWPVKTDLTRYVGFTSGGEIEEVKIDLDSCFAEITYSF